MKALLADVLCLLPETELESSLWKNLGPEARAALRQSCNRARVLTDSLVTACDFKPPAPNEVDEGGRIVRFDAQRSYLVRLPHLDSISLLMSVLDEDSRHPTYVTEALQHLSAAMADRTTALRGVLGGRQVTALNMPGLGYADAFTLRDAFPHLQSLTVRGQSTGPVFRALATLPFLHTLVVASDDFDSEEPPPRRQEWVASVSALAGLTSLRIIRTATPEALRGAMPCLTALRRLRHCDIYTSPEVAEYVPLHDYLPLLSLATLEHVELPHVTSPPAAASAEGAAVHHALSLLTRLHSLNLGDEFMVSHECAAALVPLRRLTLLEVGGAVLPRGQGLPRGCLTALRHLSLCRHDGPQLWASLHALLPLPSLTHVSDSSNAVTTSTFDAVPGLPLLRSMQLLAACPNLRLDTVEVSWSGLLEEPSSLWPLVGRVDLLKVTVADGGGVVGLAAALGGHVATLVTLVVERTAAWGTMVAAWGVGADQGGWGEVARAAADSAARRASGGRSALKVLTRPPPCPELRARMAAIAAGSLTFIAHI